ncbi:M24 family metallopeptidase [Nocardia sp. NPDC019395]|uniref:M24 family metallopeptidase n=1 Tax=Nocardia sp. NPDC019395 TaxID=3154686 RepID=UPI0033CDF90A
MATEILPDDRALRVGRRDRVLAQMQAHDLDVLIAGRQANARYLSGVPQLWVAGTRPFGPVALLFRKSGSVHLHSTWDEGIPEDIPHANLYETMWDPRNLMAVLRDIDGAATARRVGTDALSPNFTQLLPIAFPNAEIVDGELAFRAARRIKLAAEIDTMRTGLRVAEHGLAAALAQLAPGVTEQALAGVLLEACAAGGVSTPATQDAAWVTARNHPWQRATDDRRVQEGDLVAFSSGVLGDGYIGEIGRTWPVGPVTPAIGKLYGRWNRLWDSLLRACRPGASAAGLLDAYLDVGEPLPAMPVARGLGMGFDPPVVAPALRGTAEAELLEPGMVLAVTGYVWAEGTGAVFTRDAVLIDDDGPQVLTTSPYWEKP